MQSREILQAMVGSTLFQAGEWIISGREECFTSDRVRGYFRPESALSKAGECIISGQDEAVVSGRVVHCFKAGRSALFLAGEWVNSGREECIVLTGEWIISDQGINVSAWGVYHFRRGGVPCYGRGVHVMGWGVYHFRPGGVNCFWLRSVSFQAGRSALFLAGE
jgi:hypothetical protein